MSQPRLLQLDILRAFCVFGVLGRHLNPCPPEINRFLFDFTNGWNYGGWVGVDVFFVLSGFLVSGLIFREYQKNGDVSVKRFFARRGFKIYPSFYLMILATILINPLLNLPVPLKTLLAEIFFVQNLIFGRLWLHTWSLAVEEHFYIGLAITSYLLLRFRKRKGNAFAAIPYIFGFLAIACFILRLLMAIYKGTNISPTPFRIDALFFGVFLAYLWHFRGLAENFWLEKYAKWLIRLGLLMLAPMFFFMSVVNPYVFVIGLTTNYLAGGLLLLGFLKTDFGEEFSARKLAYIGTYSYSIYLWHLPVQVWFGMILNNGATLKNWFVYAAISTVGAILFGIAMSKIVEYPILRFRDRYFPPLVRAIESKEIENKNVVFQPQKIAPIYKEKR